MAILLLVASLHTERIHLKKLLEAIFCEPSVIDSFVRQRQPAALILGDQIHDAQAILHSLGTDNWMSVVTDFDHALDQMSLQAFDVVIIVSKLSEPQILLFAQHVRSQSTRTRVATVLAVSDEVSPEGAKLAGIDLVVAFEVGVRDVVLHIAQAATRRVEKNRLKRKKSLMT